MIYNIDLNSQTVRAICKDGEKCFIGIAKCSPEDVYSEEKGMLIAKKRALKQMCKARINKANKEISLCRELMDKHFKLIGKNQIRIIELEQELHSLTNE